MKGKPIVYSKEELVFLKDFCKLPRKELTEKFNAKFKRDCKASVIKALCERKGWLTGRDGKFSKGHKSWNKGKTGYMGANNTSFRPGDTPKNTKPLWTERVNKDGYVEIKVQETNPHTGCSTRYVLKHLWLWRQKYGEIPKGKFLKFKDGNRKNHDLKNLLLVDRALLPALNKRGYDHASDDCKPLILNVCRLQQIICKHGTTRKPRL